MIVIVGAAAYEGVLVQISYFGADILRQRCRNRDKVSHSVESLRALKTGPVEIQE